MKNIIVTFDRRAEKQLSKLPEVTPEKFRRQLKRLLTSKKHPSLRVKKMRGEDKWEARIDRKYRFTFIIDEDRISILTIGPHDEGLGKR